VSDRIPTVSLSTVTRGRKLTAALAFATLVVLVAVLQVVSLPEQTRLWKELLNAGHVLLFGVLAIFALWSSTRLFADRLRERYQHYLIALVTTIAIGSLTEILQLWAPRDANLADWARNIAGAACFLGFYSTYDPRLTEQWHSLWGSARNTVMACAVVTSVAALVPLLTWTTAYAYRNHAFPEIVSFASYWRRLFLDVRGATLIVTKRPVSWTTARTTQVGRLTLDRNGYPGLEVQEPYADWSKYRYLRFGVYSEMAETIQLTIRIHDRMHNNEYRDRFNKSFTILPGVNEFRIPLGEIRTAPVSRELDLRNIAGLSVFAVHPRKPYVIDIDCIWLE
jgi:VanZ family protein